MPARARTIATDSLYPETESPRDAEVPLKTGTKPEGQDGYHGCAQATAVGQAAEIDGAPTPRDRSTDTSQRVQEGLFFTVFNSSPIAMSIRELPSTGHARLLYVNDAYCALTGYTRGEVIGFEAYEMPMWRENRAMVEQLAQGYRAHGRLRSVQVEIVRKGGERRVILVSAEPIQIDGVRCVLVTQDEVTPLVDAQRALREREAEIVALNVDLERRVDERTQELAAANRELEAFSYSVSHDLRAPLRHVTGFVQLLEEEAGDALSAQAREHLAEIGGAASRMGALIDNLLEFSRVGRGGLQMADVNLGELARDVIAELTHDIGDRWIEWNIGVLPTVRGDRHLLRQVLQNLVGNAVKYSRTREVSWVEIGAMPGEPGESIVFVRDNGVGFDMRYSGKLFGVFQRLHAASQFEGTGVGLANVQRIVHRHGGRVWAVGAVDQGATFFVALKTAPALGTTDDGAATRREEA